MYTWTISFLRVGLQPCKRKLSSSNIFEAATSQPMVDYVHERKPDTCSQRMLGCLN